MNGEVNPIDDPPKDFFGEGPRPITGIHLFLGDGVFSLVLGYLWWWKDGVDAMDEGLGEVGEVCPG